MRPSPRMILLAPLHFFSSVFHGSKMNNYSGKSNPLTPSLVLVWFMSTHKISYTQIVNILDTVYKTNYKDQSYKKNTGRVGNYIIECHRRNVGILFSKYLLLILYLCPDIGDHQWEPYISLYRRKFRRTPRHYNRSKILN